MTDAEIIAKCTKETGLPFLVIGGMAVMAHGFGRDTFDLDYLVRRKDRALWCQELGKYGYEIFHEHTSFIQFASRNGWTDLDLMLVTDETFDGMFAASMIKNIDGVQTRFPSLEHLLAMKLHVLKQELRHRMLGDMDDVINLVMVNRVDLREEKWRQVFLKYGSLDLYEKVRHATTP